MAHGQPDYGSQAAKETVYGLTDIGELAARLGSIVTFDRRGDVVFLDDFESGIAGWSTAVSGTGGAVGQSALRYRSGGFSAKLTAGSDTFKSATIVKYLPYPVLGNLGVEISFSNHDDMDYLVFSISLYNGTTGLSARIKYDHVNQVLQYYGDDAAYHNLETSYQLAVKAGLFNTMKLVLDFEGGTYRRLLINEDTWDLSSYDIRSSASVGTPNMTVEVYHYGTAGNNPYVYIDDVIVTQNEPD